MPRTKGAVNKPKENPPAKYRVTLRNPFFGTETTIEFCSVQDISNYFKEHGVHITRSGIDKYINERNKESPFYSFEKIYH